MKTYNRKHKPKHCTKPKWKTKCVSSVSITPYFLITRIIKDKYNFKDSFFSSKNNIPKYEFLSKSIKLKSKKEK